MLARLADYRSSMCRASAIVYLFLSLFFSCHYTTSTAFEELILLLRCCLVILNLLAYNQNLLFGKGRDLLLILKALISSNVREGESEKRSCSVSFEKVVSHECEYVDGDNGCSTSFAEHFAASLHFLEPSDPYHPFLCSLLEVSNEWAKVVGFPIQQPFEWNSC